MGAADVLPRGVRGPKGFDALSEVSRVAPKCLGFCS
jgi:hypothetical protein